MWLGLLYLLPVIACWTFVVVMVVVAAVVEVGREDGWSTVVTAARGASRAVASVDELAGNEVASSSGDYDVAVAAAVGDGDDDAGRIEPER